MISTEGVGVEDSAGVRVGSGVKVDSCGISTRGVMFCTSVGSAVGISVSSGVVIIISTFW